MKDIVIYTDIHPARNDSISPSGLLEWIIDFFNKKGYQYRLLRKIDNFKNLDNKLIIVYPSHKINELTRNILLRNRIILLGPDSNSVEAYSLLKHKIPIFKLKILKKIFFTCFIRILDEHNLRKEGSTIVVGEQDYKYLKKVKDNTFFLPHPFLSSLKIVKPLSVKIPINGLILIGKLRGVPVGFERIEPFIEKYLIPLATSFKLTLFIFESTGLKINNLKHQKSVVIIKRSDELTPSFFQSKLMINMTTCGGGTANRSLSSLYDGAFLFSSTFGARNISRIFFKGQLFVSKHSPSSKLFFQDLEKFINVIKSTDNRDKINLLNRKSEEIFHNILKNG